MAKQDHVERPELDADFLVVSFSKGKLDAAAHFRSPLAEAYRTAKSRAAMAGTVKFQVFQILRSDMGLLHFQRIVQ